MKLISCHDGKLHALEAGDDGLATPGDKTFRTALPALDALPPGGAFARGAVHELLAAPADGTPLFLAAVLARGAAVITRDKGTRGQGDKGTAGRGEEETRRQGDKGAALPASFTLSSCPLVPLSSFSSIIWSDPRRELYPPALAALSIPLERVFLLRPEAGDQLWAVAECLRCRGVGAVVAAAPGGLSRVEARRLQLAAERGGAAAVLMRPLDRHGRPPDVYAAATRWLVAPSPGERTIQRWRIQLIHGHGGQVGETIVLEHHRDAATFSEREQQQRVQAHPVREAAELADRPAPPQPQPASRHRASA